MQYHLSICRRCIVETLFKGVLIVAVLEREEDQLEEGTVTVTVTSGTW
jgi:hypothetical protein